MSNQNITLGALTICEVVDICKSHSDCRKRIGNTDKFKNCPFLGVSICNLSKAPCNWNLDLVIKTKLSLELV